MTEQEQRYRAWYTKRYGHEPPKAGRAVVEAIQGHPVINALRERAAQERRKAIADLRALRPWPWEVSR